MSIPTNMIQAASQVMSGDLGQIEDLKIGELMLSALSGLSGEDSKDVTKRSMRAGFEMTLAAIKKPRQRDLEIVLANPELSAEVLVQAALTGSFAGITSTWREKKELLYEIYNSDELIIVQTHEDIYTNAIISSITPHYEVNENWDAFFATVHIEELKINGAESDGIIDAAGEVSIGAIA